MADIISYAFKTFLRKYIINDLGPRIIFLYSNMTPTLPLILFWFQYTEYTVVDSGD